MPNPYPVYDNLADYDKAFRALDWNHRVLIGDREYEPSYTGDVTVILGEFQCPCEVYTQGANRVLDAFYPSIVDGQWANPVRVRLWADNPNGIICSASDFKLDFPARMEIIAHGTPLTPLVVVGFVIIALSAVVISFNLRVFFGSVGRGVEYTGEALRELGRGLGDLGSGLGDIGTGIGKQIIPASLIIGGFILGGIYLSNRGKELSHG